MLDQLDSTQAAAKTAAGGAQTEGIFSSEKGDDMREQISKNKGEAAELEAFRAQLREEKEGVKGETGADLEVLEKAAAENASEKRVVRQKVIKTYPDGTQKVSFRYIVQAKDNAPDVLRVIQERRFRRQAEAAEESKFLREAASSVLNSNVEDKILGHATFIDEDEEYEQAFKLKFNKKGKSGKKKAAIGGSTAIKLGELQTKRDGKKGRRQRFTDDDYAHFSKKAKTTGADRNKRRMREEKPHIALQTKFRAIVEALLRMEEAQAFNSPVSQKVYPDYR